MKLVTNLSNENHLYQKFGNKVKLYFIRNLVVWIKNRIPISQLVPVLLYVIRLLSIFLVFFCHLKFY